MPASAAWGIVLHCTDRLAAPYEVRINYVLIALAIITQRTIVCSVMPNGSYANAGSRPPPRGFAPLPESKTSISKEGKVKLAFRCIYIYTGAPKILTELGRLSPFALYQNKRSRQLKQGGQKCQRTPTKKAPRGSDGKGRGCILLSPHCDRQYYNSTLLLITVFAMRICTHLDLQSAVLFF